MTKKRKFQKYYFILGTHYGGFFVHFLFTFNLAPALRSSFHHIFIFKSVEFNFTFKLPGPPLRLSRIIYILLFLALLCTKKRSFYF